MPELRYNSLSQHWVIIAPNRAARPDDSEHPPAASSRTRVPAYKTSCPFCPGNEHETPPELFRIPTENSWNIRVVPNKYEALSLEGSVVHSSPGLFQSVTGVGIHEVIIEHAHHNALIAYMSDAELLNLFTVYRNRHHAAAQDPRIETIIIFKNHGRAAGSSLEHPHSQLIAVPIIPTHIETRLAAAHQHWQKTGTCLACATIAEELQRNERIIHVSKHFISLVPYAALTPYHVWIFPRQHGSSFGSATDEQLQDLGIQLRAILRRLYEGLQNPDFNFSIRSVPVKRGEVPYYHWYLTLVPRITFTAGFELNSGMFINVVAPEESAAFLRENKGRDIQA